MNKNRHAVNSKLNLIPTTTTLPSITMVLRSSGDQVRVTVANTVFGRKATSSLFQWQHIEELMQEWEANTTLWDYMSGL